MTPKILPKRECSRNQGGPEIGSRLFYTLASLSAAALVIACSTGCKMVSTGTTDTKSVVQSLTRVGNKAGSTNDVTTLQSEVMREADEYAGTIAQACDDFRTRVPTAEARDAAQQWKLNEATAAYINATGENPLVNAVGMVVLSSLSRMVVEDYWVKEKFGEPARPLLEAQRQLESNAWSLVAGVLTPDQQEELRKLVHKSREKNPHLRYIPAMRLPELAGALDRVQVEAERQRPNSLFSLLYLNPLAGLDPTTQAIQQTRILAQRIMYYAQRAPTLLSWQVELLVYQLAAQPETQQVLADADRLTQSMQVFAKTAEGLPKLINDQREAAIDQIFADFAKERTNILATLNSQEAQLRELLPQVRQTFTAGGDMANSVNGAVKSLESFVRYVSPPDTNSTPQPSGTNSQPFNVLDYGRAATQVGTMAKDLNAMLTSLDQNTRGLKELAGGIQGDSKRLVNHAFLLALALIVVLILGLAFVALVHRGGIRLGSRPDRGSGA